jgi:hypothetical protein
MDLSTCDNGVVATSSLSCRTSKNDQNQIEANLEYLGWIEKIIATNKGKFKLLLLYCK